jgi:hypothetical protein
MNGWTTSKRKGFMQANKRLSSAGGGISIAVGSSWNATEKSMVLDREWVTEKGPTPMSTIYHSIVNMLN